MSDAEHIKELEKQLAEHAQERERLAHWMTENSFATGHGDTIESLVAELKWQFTERKNAAAQKRERLEDALADAQANYVASREAVISRDAKLVQAAEREQAAVAAALREVEAKLTYLNEQYTMKGGMLLGLLEAVSIVKHSITPAHESALDKNYVTRQEHELKLKASAEAGYRLGQQQYGSDAIPRTRPCEALDKLIAEARREGAKEMRGAAAAHCESRRGLPTTIAYTVLQKWADEIRALPLEENAT